LAQPVRVHSGRNLRRRVRLLPMNKEFGGADVSIHLASQPPLRGDGKLASQLVLLTIPTLNLFIADVTRIATRVAPYEQGWFRVEVSRPCDRKKSQGRGTEHLRRVEGPSIGSRGFLALLPHYPCSHYWLLKIRGGGGLCRCFCPALFGFLELAEHDLGDAAGGRVRLFRVVMRVLCALRG